MKQGEVLNKIMMGVLFGAILLYLGVYVWDALNDPYTTVTAYSCTVDDTMEATGFLVREEQVIQGTGTVVDQLFREGEKVARGETVAMLYSSTAAADRRNQIQALETERTQIQYALNKSSSVSENTQLSGEIIEAIATLRSSVGAEEFTQLETQSMELKSLVYQRAGAYGGEGDGGVAALQSQMQNLDSQIAALQGQAAQDTTRISVDQSGIYSGVVDGYETVLTPEVLETLTPTDLKRLGGQTMEQDTSAVGKLITDATWYFVCPLSEEEAGNLVEGRTVSVRFSRDWSGEVAMKVERIGPPQDGQMVVILSTNRFLSDTTLLRRQTVDLVFSSKSGIRVPKSAIRVESRTYTDEETGQAAERLVTGVYALVGSQSEFKLVEILDQRDDYCVVQAISTDDVKAARKDLRAGDQVIVAGQDLFDGKVIR